jgi:hypothetical protein
LWKRVQSAVATSAMPIGMPGWPDFAASTASIARARMALAICQAWVGGRAKISAWWASTGLS